MADGHQATIGDDGHGNVAVAGENITVIIYEALRRRQEDYEAAEAPTVGAIGPNPYKGLAAFEETDANRFFGRETLIKELWERFHALHEPVPGAESASRLLPIVGPSGSGKSSLARAGLVPELARRPLAALKSPRIAVCAPGPHPLEALAAVLARIDAPNDDRPVSKIREFTDELARQNARSEHDGLRRIADALPNADRRALVVLVDQFEELYSLCDDKRERDAFVENLLVACSDRNMRVSIILTLRNDFISATREHPNLNHILTHNCFSVPPMTEPELRSAIAEPAKQAGHPIEKAIVDLLIAETAGREGALPLLQFALNRIWIGLGENTSPSETIRTLGGVGGALASEAQRLYDNLARNARTADQRIVRRAFVAMVQLGEGTADTRRVARLSEFLGRGDDPEHVRNVLLPFTSTETRLVRVSHEESQEDGEPTYELAHEALIASWDLLRAWLGNVADKAESRRIRSDLRLQRRLSLAAAEWKSNRGELWRGADLRRLNEMGKRCRDDLSREAYRFWRASLFRARLRKGAVAAVAVVVFLGAALYVLSIYGSAELRTAEMENAPLPAGGKNVDERGLQPNLSRNRPVILMAFSGDGSRAAALALAVLEELKRYTYSIGTQKRRLVDDIEVVSSVSGGSVTAAYLGLYGPDDTLRLREFLMHDNMATLQVDPEQFVRSSAYFVGLTSLLNRAGFAFSTYTRINALRDLLDEQLFDRKTFAAMAARRHPIVVLNAFDMASGSTFEFTADRFNDICSDISSLPISVGVSASAAYPILLSPVDLKNYAGPNCAGDVPSPSWIQVALQAKAMPYIDHTEFQRARYANALRRGNDAFASLQYLHLLDGTLADNFAINSLMEVTTSLHGSVPLLREINNGAIGELVVISVAARSSSQSISGDDPDTPGMLPVLGSVISNSTNAALASANTMLRAALAEAPRNAGLEKARFYPIEVDFDQLLPSQRQLQAIVNKTMSLWSISLEQLDAVDMAGRLLLKQHPCFQKLLIDLGISADFIDKSFAEAVCPDTRP
ncbi:MAG TPA: ATP-binding protein [Stellaceae bacterium]|nr:ATP-binding protein [Stellaceae bacterium]